MEGPVRRKGRTSQKGWQDQSEGLKEPDRRWQNQKNEMSRPVRSWRTRQERWQDQKGEIIRQMQYDQTNRKYTLKRHQNGINRINERRIRTR